MGGDASVTGGASSCSANSYFCDLGSVPDSSRLCSAAGEGSSLFQSCTPTQFCSVDPDTSVVSCRDMLCTPNQPACNNGVATFCNARGSGYVAGGTLCLAGNACDGGSCKPVLCLAGADFCDDLTVPNQIRICNGTGTGSVVKASCGAAQYCKSTTATCEAQVCTPELPLCDNNFATTCNSSGSGVNPGGSNCSDRGMFCIINGCSYMVDSAYPDPSGATGTPDHEYFYAYDIYAVTESRTLREIEMYLYSTKIGQTIDWAVHESTSQNGAYIRVFSASTTSTTDQYRSVYESTGPISVPLVVGRYYAIGVSLPHTVAPTDTVKAWLKSSSSPKAVSFGTMLGGSRLGSYSTSGTFHFAQRVHTGP